MTPQLGQPERAPRTAFPSGTWILGIDISAPGGGVALLSADGEMSVEEALAGGRPSARVLLPAIERLLSAAGAERERIAVVAVALGPGSFTGMRIGVSTAKGIAFALGRPLYGVSSLEAMARAAAARRRETGAPPPRWILPYRDARHGEIFAALFGPNRSAKYSPSAWPRTGEDAAVRPEAFPLPEEGDLLLAGAREELPAAFATEGSVGRRLHIETGPAALEVARLAREGAARGDPPAPPDLAPRYRRRPRAETEWGPQKT